MTLPKPCEFWSNTDLPYQCLRDSKRTLAFQDAISRVVKPGDIVIDVGAGSGILSFFAAAAGATKVYAVEVESVLAKALRENVRANNLANVIEVVESDITNAQLPHAVDVVICEMMETGLLDEHQVPAINFLHARGIISQRTRLVPSQYETFIEVGESDFVFYGFKLRLPRHSWPFLSQRGPDCGWLPGGFVSRSSIQKINSVDFATSVQPKIETVVSTVIFASGLVNAVRLSASARLSENIWLGATNALNGDKVLPVDDRLVHAGENIQARISYQMGGGLSSFKFTWID